MLRWIARALIVSTTLFFWILWIGILGFWVRSRWIEDLVAFETETALPTDPLLAPLETARRYLIISSDSGIGLAIRREIRAASRRPILPMWYSASAMWYPQPWGPWSLPPAQLDLSHDVELHIVTGNTSLDRALPSLAPGPPATTSPPFPTQSITVSRGIPTGASLFPSADTTGLNRSALGSAYSTKPAGGSSFSGFGGASFKLANTPSAIASDGNRVHEDSISRFGTSVITGSNAVAAIRTGSGMITSGILSIPQLNPLQTPLTMPPPATLPPGDFRFFAYQTGGGADRAIWAGVIIFPYWAGQLIFFLPALLVTYISIRVFRRHRRIKEGLCPQCGYDLRASPQRCPECGRANPFFKELAPAVPTGAGR